MRLKFNLLFLFLIFLCEANSQESSVTVIAPTYEGKKVYVWVEDDLFTRHLDLMEEGVIKDSLFTFSTSVDEIEKLRIAIDFQYASIFIEADSDYELLFPQRNEEYNRSLAWNTQVELSIISAPENDINQLLIGFNNDLDRFFSSLIYENEDKEDSLQERNVKTFSTRESLISFKQYKRGWDSIYSSFDNPFFDDYRKYAAASIEYSLGEKRDSLFSNYLDGKDCPLSNPEYIRFFHDYYQNYFDFYRFYPLDEKLKKALKSEDVRIELLRLIAGDSQTGNRQSQELVLLKGVYDLLLKNPQLDSIAIRVIEELQSESEYEENVLICSHLLEILTKGKKGTYFPDFECITSFNDSILFSSFESEFPVYIQVFASWSSTSKAEMELMKDLYKRYNSKVRFISISIDPEKSDFDSFYGKHREYKWDFVWVGQHPDILKHLNIYDVPVFYLLRGDLLIENWPAASPSMGIEKIFYELELQERERKKFRFWEDQTNKSNKEK